MDNQQDQVDDDEHKMRLQRKLKMKLLEQLENQLITNPDSTVKKLIFQNISEQEVKEYFAPYLEQERKQITQQVEKQLQQERKNLLKLQDKLNDESQIKQLKAQHAQNQKNMLQDYQKLQSQMKLNENKLKQQIKQLKDELENKTNEIQQLNNKITQQEDDLIKYVEKQSELQQQLQFANQQIQAYQQQTQKLDQVVKTYTNFDNIEEYMENQQKKYQELQQQTQQQIQQLNNQGFQSKNSFQSNSKKISIKDLNLSKSAQAISRVSSAIDVKQPEQKQMTQSLYQSNYSTQPSLQQSLHQSLQQQLQQSQNSIEQQHSQIENQSQQSNGRMVKLGYVIVEFYDKIEQLAKDLQIKTQDHPQLIKEAIQHIIKNARITFCNIDELQTEINNILATESYKEQLIQCKNVIQKYKQIYQKNQAYCDLLYAFKQHIQNKNSKGMKEVYQKLVAEQRLQNIINED